MPLDKPKFYQDLLQTYVNHLRQLEHTAIQTNDNEERDVIQLAISDLSYLILCSKHPLITYHIDDTKLIPT